MTSALNNIAQGGAFAGGVDPYVYPQFIGYALRAPSTQDIYNPGVRWQDNSVSPPVIYETTGSGLWYSGSGGGEILTSLTVIGPSVLTGGTLINSSGSANTTIGTGGTGATFIGNTTGNTVVTGSETITGNLGLTGAASKLSVSAATPASASIGTTAPLTAGSITVATTAITANSLVFFTTHTLGTVPVPQSYRVSARTAGTSFTIQSSGGTDTSTVDYWIIN